MGTADEIRQLTNEQVVYVHVNDAPAGIPLDQYQDLVRRLPGQTGVQDIGAFMDAGMCASASYRGATRSRLRL